MAGWKWWGARDREAAVGSCHQVAMGMGGAKGRAGWSHRRRDGGEDGRVKYSLSATETAMGGEGWRGQAAWRKMQVNVREPQRRPSQVGDARQAFPENPIAGAAPLRSSRDCMFTTRHPQHQAGRRRRITTTSADPSQPWRPHARRAPRRCPPPKLPNPPAQHPRSRSRNGRPWPRCSRMSTTTGLMSR